MKTKYFAVFPFVTSLLLCLLTNSATATDKIVVKGNPVDHAILDARGISKNQPLLVRLFDTRHAELGKAKHQDIARTLARTAPHLLAADIVEYLRDAGFTSIFLAESGRSPSGDYLVLDGAFIKLNPGSQAARAWIGFGAGKSKICIEGRIKTRSGNSIGKFSDCSSGLGWGESSAQMNKDTDRLGHNIAKLLIDWSEDKLK